MFPPADSHARLNNGGFHGNVSISFATSTSSYDGKHTTFPPANTEHLLCQDRLPI